MTTTMTTLWTCWGQHMLTTARGIIHPVKDTCLWKCCGQGQGKVANMKVKSNLCLRRIKMFGFGIEFFEDKDIVIFGHFIVIDCIKRYSYHIYFPPISTSWFCRFRTGCICLVLVMVNDVYLWIITYSQHCFLWNSAY